MTRVGLVVPTVSVGEPGGDHFDRWAAPWDTTYPLHLVFWALRSYAGAFAIRRRFNPRPIQRLVATGSNTRSQPDPPLTHCHDNCTSSVRHLELPIDLI